MMENIVQMTQTCVMGNIVQMTLRHTLTGTV